MEHDPLSPVRGCSAGSIERGSVAICRVPGSRDPICGSNSSPHASLCCGVRYVWSETVVIAKLEQPDMSKAAGCVEKAGFAEDISGSATRPDHHRSNLAEPGGLGVQLFVRSSPTWVIWFGDRCVRSKTVVIAKLEQLEESKVADCLNNAGFAEDIPGSAPGPCTSRNLALLRNRVEEREPGPTVRTVIADVAHLGAEIGVFVAKP